MSLLTGVWYSSFCLLHAEMADVLCEAVIRILEHRRFSHSAPVPSSSSVNDMKQVAAEMVGHKCWW